VVRHAQNTAQRFVACIPGRARIHRSRALGRRLDERARQTRPRRAHRVGGHLQERARWTSRDDAHRSGGRRPKRVARWCDAEVRRQRVGRGRGDRKSAFFRRFISAAPSQFVRQPLRKQCETTLNVVIAELDKLDPKHALRAFASPLGRGRAARPGSVDDPLGAPGRTGALRGAIPGATAARWPRDGG
jgi:hypothetical protein